MMTRPPLFLSHLTLVAALLFVLGCRSEPVCILYPTYQQPVQIIEVPKDILAAFYKACPQAKIVSVSKELGGKSGKGFVFWVFRFEQNGKLREDLIGSARDVPYIYSVQNN